MEDDKLRVERNQKTPEWEAVLVWVSLAFASSESQRLVELWLSVSEVASPVAPLAGVFLEEGWLKTAVGGAGQAEAPWTKEMVEEEQGVAQWKRGKEGEGLAVGLRKREMEAAQVGALRLVEKVASQVGACQVVAMK